MVGIPEARGKAGSRPAWGFFVLLAVLAAAFAVPAEAARILYQSDFASVPDGGLPEGFVVRTGSWEVRGGRLIGQSASQVNGQIIFGDPAWTNYAIEATITFLSANEPTRWAAVMYRGPETGRVPFYLFTIRQGANATNGLELAYRTPSETWNVLITASWTSPIEIGRPYHVRVLVHDTAAVYFLDGVKVIETATLVQRPAGPVGFVTNGTRIAVDNVIVRELEEEELAMMPNVRRGTVPDTAGPSVPLVIAHRGASGVEPENTVAAMKRAVEVGADLIEIDVQRTLDGQLVVIHDATVDRTAKGAYTGPVAGLTLEQIKTLDAGAWKNPQRRGERVPTLEEALRSVEGNAIFLIENKVTGIERDIAEVIRRTGTQRNVVFQSFDPNSVRAFRALMPEVPAGVLFGNPGIADDAERAAMMVETALKANAQFVAVNYGAVTPQFVRYIQARGLNVWVWTVDAASDMRRMIEAGVDGIITNYPEILREVLNE